MDDQSGLVSFFFMLIILAAAIFFMVYWMDIDEEEKESKRYQGFDRVEWSRYLVTKDDDLEKKV
ncbi:hypothetical protein UFOVP270_19 [uncultured Caudovirales phage]|uniref:Uncharacterized protein n=1 Tax=uncultured Caudovirales phage TaxID=2100421 RepID=A0A6J5L573_9CAUD|nr:hypothetical protein UFOVP101_37 [uncultured Caudovirales phage]CAB4134122.1 hypothetical protein UFOVP270_19 [uncultured Caudovirales phage]